MTNDSAMCCCYNCGWVGPLSVVGTVSDVEMRVAAGECMPAGECPDCYALVHLTDSSNADGMLTVLARALADRSMIIEVDVRGGFVTDARVMGPDRQNAKVIPVRVRDYDTAGSDLDENETLTDQSGDHYMESWV